MYDLAGNLDAPDNLSRLEIELAMIPEFTDSTMIRFMDVAGVHEGLTYIFSKNNMTFKEDGACAGSFNSQGQGPGEWMDEKAMVVNPMNGNWEVLDWSMRVFSYTPEGVFSGCDTLGIKIGSICENGRGWVCSSGPFSDDEITLYYLNSGWEVTDSVKTGFAQEVYIFPNGRAAFSPKFCWTGKEVLYMRGDTIYDITDPKNCLTALGMVDVGSHTKPAEANPTNAGEFMDVWLNPVLEATEDAVMLRYNFAGKSGFRFFDRESGELLGCFTGSIADKEGGLPYEHGGKRYFLQPIGLTHEGWFYFSANEGLMSEMTGEEDVNPGLFRVRVKKGR